jgi:hypothetical protein
VTNHLQILQGVDMQLGLAIENPKATLAVKRRLACEMVKYWQQVLPLSLTYFQGYEHMGLFFPTILSFYCALNSYSENLLHLN